MSLDDRITLLVNRIRLEFNALRRRLPLKTKMISDATGTVTWVFPSAYDVPPIVTATAMSDASGRPCVAAIVSVTASQAVAKVFRLRTSAVVSVNITVDPVEAISGIGVYLVASPV